MLKAAIGCLRACISYATPMTCAVAAGVALAANAGHAAYVAPALYYDSPTVVLAPGGSVDIGATMMVGSAGLTTDGYGVQTVTVSGVTVAFGGLDFAQQLDINSLFVGTTAYIFAQHAQFVPGSQGQLENLNLNPGSSFHVDLGRIVADPTLPAGNYTTDIGVTQECPLGICDLSPFDLPSFADAGTLTVDVANIPEPAGIAVPALGVLLGLALIRRTPSLSWRGRAGTK